MNDNDEIGKLQKIFSRRLKPQLSRAEVYDEIKAAVLMGEHYSGTPEHRAKEKWGSLFDQKTWNEIGALRERITAGTSTFQDNYMHDEFQKLLRPHEDIPTRKVDAPDKPRVWTKNGVDMEMG